MACCLNIYDCIDIVTCMFKKIGADVHEAAPFDQQRDCLLKATILGHKLDPMFRFDAPISSTLNISIGEFAWYAYKTDNIFNALCMDIRGFKIRELDTVVVNPFLGAENLCNAKSKEEAFIQIDLAFPGDNSKRVHKYVAKKDAERRVDGKERCMA